MNEPTGFTPRIVCEWDQWPPGPGQWWWDSGFTGDVSLDGAGNVVWTYPAGMSGGRVPGSKITEESIRMGPAVYERHEGVMLSENFHGHSSSVNKFTYFPDDEADTAGITLFAGTDDGRMFIGVNALWPGQHSDSRLRWDGSHRFGREKLPNLASPTQAQAEVFRGRAHTIEVLRHLEDGWLKLWLDGMLILHYDGMVFVRHGHDPEQRGIHIAPVWGGTGDTVPETQTLTVGRSYYSDGTIIDPGGPMPVQTTVTGTIAAADKIPTSVTVEPNGGPLKKGNVVRFQATVRDQNGDPLPAENHDVNFSVTPNVRIAFQNNLLNFVDLEPRDDAVVSDPWSLTVTVANT